MGKKNMQDESIITVWSKIHKKKTSVESVSAKNLN